MPRCDTDGVTIVPVLSGANVASVTVGGISANCAGGTLSVNVNNGVANSSGSGVVPAREAIRRTAVWLAAHPCDPGGQEEMVLTDPFDYRAEDELIESWQRAVGTVDTARFATPPAYGLAYSGPGGRPRTNAEFDA